MPTLTITGPGTEVDPVALEELADVFENTALAHASAKTALQQVVAALEARSWALEARLAHLPVTMDPFAPSQRIHLVHLAADLADTTAALRLAATRLAEAAELARDLATRLRRAGEDYRAADHHVALLAGIIGPNPLFTLGAFGHAAWALISTLGWAPPPPIGAAGTLNRLAAPFGGLVPVRGATTIAVGDLTPTQRLARGIVMAVDQAGGGGAHVVAVGRADGSTCHEAAYASAAVLAGPALAAATRTCPRLSIPRAQAVPPPLTGADLVHTLDEPAGTPHTLRVLRHTTAGKVSWTVVVPGTETWSLGGDNPFDMDTNLRVSGGLPSAQEAAVAEALTQLHIPSTEPVELVGHSQGAMVVARLASDPMFTTRWSVTSALCVGGATAGVRPTGRAKVLAVENADDLVPALDGSGRNRPRAGLVTVVGQLSPDETARVAPGAVPGGGEQHMRPVYAYLVDEAEHSGNPDVQEWSANRARTLGLTAQTRTEVIDFTVSRVR